MDVRALLESKVSEPKLRAPMDAFIKYEVENMHRFAKEMGPALPALYQNGQKPDFDDAVQAMYKQARNIIHYLLSKSDPIQKEWQSIIDQLNRILATLGPFCEPALKRIYNH